MCRKSRYKLTRSLSPEDQEKRREKWRANARETYANDPEQRVFWGLRLKCRRKGIPFSITKDHMKTPETCPVLGIKLERGNDGFLANSPSVDKIIPALGYVPGNVCVISMRANTIKGDGSLQELRAVLNYMIVERNKKRVAREGPPSEGLESWFYEAAISD